MKNLIPFILFLFLSCNQIQHKNEESFTIDACPEITMINSIEFSDGSYAMSYPGCSFLLNTGEEILAVTCKHALWTGRNDNMNSISIAEDVKKWRMHLKNDTTRYLLVDKLINENKNEAIGEWNTESDYLVFSINENKSRITPLKLSTAAIQNGDSLYKVGWAFKDKEGPQRVYNSIFYKYSGSVMLVQDSERVNQAVTSGSPVINSMGQLTGIVSSWKQDHESGNWYPAPCSVDYLWEVIYHRWLDKNNKAKSPGSFNEFVLTYEKLNNCDLELSDNLIINLFFFDWLAANNTIYGTLSDFLLWGDEVKSSLQRNIVLSDEFRNQLRFNEWKINYLNGKKDLIDLDELLNEKAVYLENSMLCKFGMNLSNDNKFDQALEIMNYTVSRFSNSGPVYFYLGEVFSKMNMPTKAMENYQKCLTVYPGYPFAVERLKSLN